VRSSRAREQSATARIGFDIRPRSMKVAVRSPISGTPRDEFVDGGLSSFGADRHQDTSRLSVTIGPNHRRLARLFRQFLLSSTATLSCGMLRKAKSDLRALTFNGEADRRAFPTRPRKRHPGKSNRPASARSVIHRRPMKTRRQDIDVSPSILAISIGPSVTCHKRDFGGWVGVGYRPPDRGLVSCEGG